MLPFLKQKKSTGVIVNSYNSSGIKREGDTSPGSDEGLLICAKDLIKAINSNSALGVAAALKAAFEICESELHQEGEETNSYDELNQRAAKGNE